MDTLTFLFLLIAFIAKVVYLVISDKPPAKTPADGVPVRQQGGSHDDGAAFFLLGIAGADAAGEKPDADACEEE